MTDEIKRYIFKEGLPQEFEIVDLKILFNKQRDAITSVHRANFYHIIWFQKGNPNHMVDFQQIELKPNTLLFLNRNIVHQFDGKGDFGGKAILFTDNFFCKTEADTSYLLSTFLFNDLLSISKIDLNGIKSPVEEIFYLMEKELDKNKALNQSDILKNLLHSMLLYSERERRNQNFILISKGIDLEYVMIFKDLLEKNFHRLKQVTQYATKMAITTKRLNQATSKILGISPKQMIDERVMLEAKRLLAHTNHSVKEISFEMGFEEPTNFIKYFRRYSSSTPYEFRGDFRP